MKGIIAGAVLGLGLISQSHAEVLIDVRNDTSEDCSLAVNARIDKTKWITQGWYVFASGEEAPIILKDINDIHNVYIYNDCKKNVTSPKTETKKLGLRAITSSRTKLLAIKTKAMRKLFLNVYCQTNIKFKTSLKFLFSSVPKKNEFGILSADVYIAN